MELVGVTHVVDAITFWAQNVNDDSAVKKMTQILSEKCPKARRLMGNPIPQKVYGALFSEDSCWYRCKVQKHDDNKFEVCYIDYGNTELVSRASLVELPLDLQMDGLANKYKFWGFLLCSSVNSQHSLQGKIFLHHLIYGKKLRIQKKLLCDDGTILVRAFQGNLDIGEEVIKMKFAEMNVPAYREAPQSSWQDPPALWGHVALEQPPQGGIEQSRTHISTPKLRPAFPNQMSQIVKEKSTTTALQPACLLKTKLDKELVAENERLKEEKMTQHRSTLLMEKELKEVQTELQRVKEARVRDARELEKLKDENSIMQQKAGDLVKQLRDAEHKLQVAMRQAADRLEAADKRLETAVGDKFTQLALKVESLRGVREVHARGTVADTLLEAIGIVTHDSISSPASLGKLEAAWEMYNLAQETVKTCQKREDLEGLIEKRNDVRRALVVAVDDFLQDVDGLPISERMSALQAVSASLTTVFGPSSIVEDVGDKAFEVFRQWKSLKEQEMHSVREGTDEALESLCSWFEKVAKFFQLSSDITVSVDGLQETTEPNPRDITVGVDGLLRRAELNLGWELKVLLAEQNNQDVKIVSEAVQRVMWRIENEQHLLRALQEKYLLNTQFKREVLQWQHNTPRADELFSVKKRIRSLRSQLRWRLVEEGSLEEAEEVDLPEIEKKKQQISETRNALFQEILLEKEEYKKLSVLAKGAFPELPLLYSDTDLLSYMSSDGLVVKSLDRDLFDGAPLRELSSRRPLVCTEFQCQQVALKGYSVDAQSEARMVDRATEYYRASMLSERPTGLLPLLALFFGKSDPLAYVMVPYFAGGALQVVQKSSPLNISEIMAVMRGVALGLQTLHRLHITHGSLHPNNVFVLQREQGMLGDYDFTKDPEQRAADVGMVGSLSLVAPEVSQGQLPSPTCDMYAFGCLLLWLHSPEVSFTLKPDGCTPDTSEIKVDPKLQILLSKLLCSSGRLTVSEVLSDDYFLGD